MKNKITERNFQVTAKKNRKCASTFYAFVCLIAMFVGSEFALADRDIGNGGDVVVCRDSKQKILRIELLDFYEARILHGIHYDLGNSSATITEKIEIALARLQGVAPRTAQRFSAKLASFFQDASFVRGINLVDIPDSEHELIERGCQIEQIAVQRATRVPEDKLYTINQDLWDFLDTDNRVGLMLHEVIYGELSKTQKNSRSTRYLNSYIASGKIELLSPMQYLRLADQVGFPKLEYKSLDLSIRYTTPRPHWPDGGFPESARVEGTWEIGGKTFQLEEESVQFYPNGQPKGLWMIFGSEKEIQLGTMKAVVMGEGSINFEEDGRVTYLGSSDDTKTRLQSTHFDLIGSFEFGVDGHLRKCFSCAGEVKVKGAMLPLVPRDPNRAPSEFYPSGQIQRYSAGANISIVIQGFQISIPIGSSLSFHANGNVADLTIYNDEPIHLRIGGTQLELDPSVTFFDDETVESGRLRSQTLLKMPSGEEVLFPAGSFIKFNRNGHVVEF